MRASDFISVSNILKNMSSEPQVPHFMDGNIGLTHLYGLELGMWILE